MDNRPIGIFDSGVGGLSAVRAMYEREIPESFIYYGDTARVPYGNRSREEITRFSLQDVRFLRSHDLKAILIACNTITVNSIDALREANPDLPIVGVVDAAAAAAAKAGKNGRFGIISTVSTAQSGVYAEKLKALRPGAEVYSQGCPKFVPLIESGHIAPDDAELLPAVEEYLAPIKAFGVDTLILGCTHYPLIREAVQNYMGPDVTLIDSGAESIDAVLSILRERDALAAPGTEVSRRFYCSGRLEEFEHVAEMFLDRSIRGLAEEIDITKF